MPITHEEFVEYLNENKDNPEVKKLFSTAITIDQVRNAVSNDESIRSWYSSQIDSAVSKGINTFKANNLSKIIEEEVSKRGQETETQRLIRELKEDNIRRDNEYKKEKLLNRALSYASEKGLPTKFIDRFVAEDEDSTLRNIDSFYSEFDKSLKIEVDKRFAEGGREISTDINKDQKQAHTELTYEQIKNMDAKELAANADAIKKFNERAMKGK